MRCEEKAECADVAAPILFVLALIVGVGVHHELTKPEEPAAQARAVSAALDAALDEAGPRETGLREVERRE